MKKTVLTFGLISGAVCSLNGGLAAFADKIGFDKSEILGYTILVLSFLVVFFGIRSYRDNIGNGQITFTKACTVGICITLISSLCYVVTWEILYFNFLPDFMDKYGAYLVEKLKASGASPAVIQAQLQQLNQYKGLYLNAAMTFIEPFPVGLVITLISAAILRKRAQSQPSPSPMPVSN